MSNIFKLNIIRCSTPYWLLLLLLIGLPVKVQAQPAVDSSTTKEQIPPDSNAANQSASIFSIEGGKRLMMEADQAIEAQEYDLAVEKLQNARQVYNQLSNFYLQLFNSFTGLDNAAAEAHRKKALDTSLERDRATYQLALVHRSQNKPELAIPLLIQIITSQSPGIGLGKKAYEQLVEIGFVDTPYTPPKPGEVKSPSGQVPPTPDAQPIAPEAPATAPTP
jgi:tetratricopeptide (TPR) repeat protein